MRTTLDIDPRVLAAARVKAAAESTSIGRAVSELALNGMAGQPVVLTKGFPVFPAVEGHVITDELVAAHRDDVA
ncbi:MAG: DUF2191 domain-containing protein [Propionibacteriaceae bacterium]|nr:DUF2191 domain-containing protein [Propionibacteriaceae bacterium]